MSTRSIQFQGMRISDIQHSTDTVDINFDYAIIIKNMDAADEDSKWYGAGFMHIEGLFDDDFEIPPLPASLESADISDNQMIYRNEVVIPVKFHGHVGLKLHFEGSELPLSIFGERLTLDLSDHEKYIEHIKAG